MTQSLQFYGGADIVSTPLSVTNNFDLFSLENVAYIILIIYLLFVLYFNMNSSYKYGYRWSIATSNDVCPLGTDIVKKINKECKRCTSYDFESTNFVSLPSNWAKLYPSCNSN